jgi:6-phosphogluconolactonase
VLAYQVDGKSAKLKLLNEVASMGAGTCHLSIDKTGKFLLVANYDSGSVAVFPVHADGSLGESSGFVQHTGTGVDPERQKGPHAHFIQTSANNRFALAADLGLDEVLVYRFDSSKGTLSPANPAFAKVHGGSGPRHFVFHPNGHFLYLVNEMASAVTVFSYDAATGAMEEKQTISALPADFKGKNDDAEIQIDGEGKFLYASNRGSDSITVFAIDGSSGTLKVVQNISSGGKTPRHFTLDPTGGFLLAANQDSDNIVTFAIDRSSGKLTKTAEVDHIVAPVCLTFVAAE